LLDRLAAQNVPVYAVGKIADVFLSRGVTTTVKTRNNADGMIQTRKGMEQQACGLIFTNLVDFDQLYGHRNDVEGYARALEAVDQWIPTLPLSEWDLLILTADHGCDPTTLSTDHSREFTPLLVAGPQVSEGIDLGTRTTLSDIGQTVAQIFGTKIAYGEGFLSEVQKG
jgi:phosphopentomutase